MTVKEHHGEIVTIDRREGVVLVKANNLKRVIGLDLFPNRYEPPEKSGLVKGAEVVFGFKVTPHPESGIPDIEHFAHVKNVPMDSDEWIKEGL